MFDLREKGGREGENDGENASSLNGDGKDTSVDTNVLLLRRKELLVLRRTDGLVFVLPRDEPVVVVGLEVLVDEAETDGVVGDALPVTRDVLEVDGEEVEATLEDGVVEGGALSGKKGQQRRQTGKKETLTYHGLLVVLVRSPGASRVALDIVSGLLDGTHLLVKRRKVSAQQRWSGENERRTKAATFSGFLARNSSLTMLRMEQKQQQPSSASSSILIIWTSSVERPTEVHHCGKGGSLVSGQTEERRERSNGGGKGEQRRTCSSSTDWTDSIPMPPSTLPEMMAAAMSIPQRTLLKGGRSSVTEAQTRRTKKSKKVGRTPRSRSG
jgi:hypothetical protein